MQQGWIARVALQLATALVLAGCAANQDGIVQPDRTAECEAVRAHNQPLADRGDPEALFQMAELHNSGCGVPYRPSHAYLDYKQAAERGHARAAMRLADFYTGSSAVSVDWNEGLFWMAVAARDPGLTARERQSIAYKQRLLLNPRLEGQGPAMMQRAEQRAAAWTPRQD